MPSVTMLITHTLPKSGISVGMCICPLQSGLYLLAFAEIFDLHCVFLSSFQFQESGMFQNIEWKKKMAAIKALDFVAASDVNCSLERGRGL